jgi:hypothetical protein
MLGTLTRESRFVRLFCFFLKVGGFRYSGRSQRKAGLSGFFVFRSSAFPDTRDAHKRKAGLSSFFFVF